MGPVFLLKVIAPRAMSVNATSTGASTLSRLRKAERDGRWLPMTKWLSSQSCWSSKRQERAMDYGSRVQDRCSRSFVF